MEEDKFLVYDLYNTYCHVDVFKNKIDKRLWYSDDLFKSWFDSIIKSSQTNKSPTYNLKQIAAKYIWC